MTLDLVHFIVLAVVILGSIFVLERTAFMANATRLKRVLVTGLGVFVVLVVFNLLWSAFR